MVQAIIPVKQEAEAGFLGDLVKDLVSITYKAAQILLTLGSTKLNPKFGKTKTQHRPV